MSTDPVVSPVQGEAAPLLDEIAWECPHGYDYASGCPNDCEPPSGVQGEAESDLLYDAWVLIANAYGGDWSKDPEWRAAAERWRDRWHATLNDDMPVCARCGARCQQTWVALSDSSAACFDCATDEEWGAAL